jgi:hypothetical protein
MKRFIALLTVMILLTGFNYSNQRPQKYATLGSYIYNLVKTTEIQIYFFRAPKAAEYFGDIKDSDYYAGAFINAAVSGILKFPQKKISPWKWIKVSDAKQLMDKAYMYKTNQKILISNVVFSELIKMDKYKKVKDNYYVTSQMEKDIFVLYSKKIAEYNKSKEKQTSPDDKINVSKKIENEYLLITLDWGEKPTGGYIIKILEAKQVGSTIEVKYMTKSPGPSDIVTQALTYPKDSIKVKVDDVSKDYKVVLIN